MSEGVTVTRRQFLHIGAVKTLGAFIPPKNILENPITKSDLDIPVTEQTSQTEKKEIGFIYDEGRVNMFPTDDKFRVLQVYGFANSTDNVSNKKEEEKDTVDVNRTEDWNLIKKYYEDKYPDIVLDHLDVGESKNGSEIYPGILKVIRSRERVPNENALEDDEDLISHRLFVLDEEKNIKEITHGEDVPAYVCMGKKGMLVGWYDPEFPIFRESDDYFVVKASFSSEDKPANLEFAERSRISYYNYQNIEEGSSAWETGWIVDIDEETYKDENGHFDILYFYSYAPIFAKPDDIDTFFITYSLYGFPSIWDKKRVEMKDGSLVKLDDLGAGCVGFAGKNEIYMKVDQNNGYKPNLTIKNDDPYARQIESEVNLWNVSEKDIPYVFGQTPNGGFFTLIRCEDEEVESYKALYVNEKEGKIFSQISSGDLETVPDFFMRGGVKIEPAKNYAQSDNPSEMPVWYEVRVMSDDTPKFDRMGFLNSESGVFVFDYEKNLEDNPDGYSKNSKYKRT